MRFHRMHQFSFYGSPGRRIRVITEPTFTAGFQHSTDFSKEGLTVGKETDELGPINHIESLVRKRQMHGIDRMKFHAVLILFPKLRTPKNSLGSPGRHQRKVSEDDGRTQEQKVELNIRFAVPEQKHLLPFQRTK